MSYKNLPGTVPGDTVRGRPQAARLADLLAACVAFTAVEVMVWKLASATSAACLAALWTLS